MDVIVCFLGVGNALRTSVCTFWRRRCYCLDWNLSWCSHSAQNGSRNIECRKIQRRYSWSHRSALCATAKLWSRLSAWQCKMSRGSYLSRLSEPELHQCSSLAICHQLNIYGMNPVDVFVTVKIHRTHYRSCLPTYALVEQHPTSFYWFYSSEMRRCCCCKRWSHTLLNSANLHTVWQFLFFHDLFWLWCCDILLILPYW